MTQRRTPRPALAVLTAGAFVALAACSSPTSDDDSGQDSAPGTATAPDESATSAPSPDDVATTAPSETSPEQAGLEAFYGQDLTWESCLDFAVTAADVELFTAVDRAECTRLEVPVDYTEPDGETAQIAVSRLPARGESLGALFTNPGGPGGPALGQAIGTAAALDGSPVPERFDVIGMDPRGVGASTPAIDCVSDEEADAGANTFPQAAIQGRWSEDDTRAIAEQCIERTGSENLLAHLGTRDVARDMEVLRSALGEEQVTYLGQSYGTRLGAVYAEMFPERVRAMVLDGAVDPSLGTFERRLTMYEGFQRAFDQMAAYCIEQGDSVLGDDPGEATQRFQEIMRPLIAEPAQTEGGREVGYNNAVGGVISGLYDSEGWPAILDGIAEVEQGRGDTLLAIGDGFGMRGDDGVWSNYLEATHVINCLDEERATSEEEVQQRTQIWEVAPFMDPGEDPEGARDLCEAWPGEPTLGYPYAQDVEGLPDTLVISITGDPSTPYDGGVALAETLGSALLTVEAEQHTIAMAGTSPCVTDVVSTYLVDLTVPEEGATCAP